MTWARWGSTAIRNGEFSISKASVNGKTIYTLWRLPLTRLGNFPTAAAAKQAMNAHQQ